MKFERTAHISAYNDILIVLLLEHKKFFVTPLMVQIPVKFPFNFGTISTATP